MEIASNSKEEKHATNIWRRNVPTQKLELKLNSCVFVNVNGGVPFYESVSLRNWQKLEFVSGKGTIRIGFFRCFCIMANSIWGLGNNIFSGMAGEKFESRV